jgi:4-azaleucine resistance transporter AzlC
VCSGEVPDGVDRRRYYFFVSLLDQLYWIAGSVAGALAGRALPFDTTGIDFSMTALFLVVMTDQWRAACDHRPALVGLGVSLVCLAAFGPDGFLIPAMAGITLALTLLRRALQPPQRPGEEADPHAGV